MPPYADCELAAHQRPSCADLVGDAVVGEERYDLRTMDVALPDGSLFVDRYRIEHLIGEGGLEDDIRDFKNRRNIDGFESRFRDALVAGLDPESSHLVTISFPFVREVQICRVDVERSPHPVFLLSKDIPQQFYIREEGAPPQPVRCPSCGELIHPPEFYVRKGNASRPLDVQRAHEYIHDHWG